MDPSKPEIFDYERLGLSCYHRAQKETVCSQFSEPLMAGVQLCSGEEGLSDIFLSTAFFITWLPGLRTKVLSCIFFLLLHE